jgi:hypothetical protein
MPLRQRRQTKLKLDNEYLKDKMINKMIKIDDLPEYTKKAVLSGGDHRPAGVIDSDGKPATSINWPGAWFCYFRKYQYDIEKIKEEMLPFVIGSDE